MKNRTCKSMYIDLQVRFYFTRICKSMRIDLQVRFYFTTTLVKAFYPKNLKRATPVSHFHFLLHSGLRFHWSCARVWVQLFSASSFLFAIVSFANPFFGIGMFFVFLTSFRWHWHFRLLFHWNCSFIFALRWSVAALPPLPSPPLSRASATLITSNLGSRKGWCSL